MQRWAKDIYWPLIVSMLGLACVGILFVYSATHYQANPYAMKQLFWVFFGFMVFFIVALMGYRFFLGTSYLFYVLSLILLVVVDVIGHTHLGAQRWLHLGPVAIQPSEFAKLATVLALANYLGSHNRWENENKILSVALLMAFIPGMLIVKQPDLGSAMLFVPMILVLLFLWGIRYRYLIAGAILTIGGVPFLWGFLKEYQKKRLMVFLNPGLDPLGAGYTAIQSRIAVGAGGMFGKGYLDGTQIQLDFVPEHHTDFIFCVIGEEWGYAGTILLLALYGLLFKAVFQVISSTTDVKAKLLAGGVLAVIFSQVFINIGMTFGFLPIAGLTLPLVSYGGSSFIATAAALGLVLSIYKGRSIF